MWVLPPAGAQLTPELIDACLRHGQCDAFQTVPTLLESLAAESCYHETLSDLKWLWFGGGPLSKSAGDKLLTLNTSAVHGFGSTEIGLLPLLPVSPANWQYHRFHESAGVKFEPAQEPDGLHELVIVKRLAENPPFQPCFELTTASDSVHTGDLWSRHPQDPGLWKYEGRADTLTVLSTGEKYDSQAVEAQLHDSPHISAALVLGGQARPILVVESETPLDDIWPEIQHVNELLPQYAKLVKTWTLVVAKNAFVRTAKGTIQRQATIEMLNPRLEQIGRRKEQTSEGTADAPLSLDQHVREVIEKKLGVVTNRHESLFAQGLDSMTVARVVRSLNKRLRKDYVTETAEVQAPQISAKHLYRHATINDLSSVLEERVTRFKTQAAKPITWRGHSKSVRRKMSNKHQAMEATVSRPRKSRNASIVITGTTGSLGTHLLHQILIEGKYDHVICLDRSDRGRTSYLEAFPEHDAKLENTSFFKVSSLDLLNCKEVPASTLKTLQSSCRAIIHNAWPVHLHLPLSATDAPSPDQRSNDWSTSLSYETHLHNLKAFLEFAQSCSHSPRFLYISSFAAVLNANPIPEDFVDDAEAPHNADYGRSKWLAEMVLKDFVAEHKEANCGVVRIGQIAGPGMELGGRRKGTGTWWNRNEVVPSMIRSSAAIQALPDNLLEKDKLRWVPVDTCARAITDIMHHGKNDQVVFNITNIHFEDTRWSGDIVNHLQKKLQVGKKDPCKIVSLQEWLRLVDEYGVRDDNPAIKVFDFYERLLTSDPEGGLAGIIETVKTMGVCESLRNLRPIEWELLERWMKSWGL